SADRVLGIGIQVIHATGVRRIDPNLARLALAAARLEIAPLQNAVVLQRSGSVLHRTICRARIARIEAEAVERNGVEIPAFLIQDERARIATVDTVVAGRDEHSGAVERARDRIARSARELPRLTAVSAPPHQLSAAGQVVLDVGVDEENAGIGGIDGE